MLRRLLSLDYVLEHPELPWLPTEQEKVAFFDSLGIDRRRLPKRLYHGANGNQTRYFALKLPIAADAKTATCQGRRKTRPEGRRKNRPLPVREGVDLLDRAGVAGAEACASVQAARLGRSGRHPSPIVATCGEG